MTGAAAAARPWQDILARMIADFGLTEEEQDWLRRGRNYMERYASILLFAAYALQEAKGGFETTYSEWSHRHWQFKRVMKHFVLE